MNADAAQVAFAAPLVAAVGRPAPNFVVDGLDGTPVSARRFRGRPLFINVFASWCGPCRIELPGIVRSYARYGPRVAYLGVDEQEPPQTVSRFAHQMGMRYPLGIDQGQLEASYRAHQIPTSIFVDRRGVVRAYYKGPIPVDVLERDLALIAGT
ncbi:MAG TPA: TlpA disulfide reductase family protein [Candidatus Sulfotelmatobacter sp.]|nr:TlpA disulfide reductase family protein [Candidatus Sulfotelmatobacter sp.]